MKHLKQTPMVHYMSPYNKYLPLGENTSRDLTSILVIRSAILWVLGIDEATGEAGLKLAQILIYDNSRKFCKPILVCRFSLQLIFLEESCAAFQMSCRVYLGRLPYGTRERDIDKFFRGYGKLREINLKNGYGFVVSYRSGFSFVNFSISFVIFVMHG